MRFCEIGSSLVIHAPAKLNLYLDVVGRRPDGYHELDTVMVSVGLFDTLEFRALPDDSIRLTGEVAGLGVGPGVSPQGGTLPPLSWGDENLVVRAARLLQRETGCRQGAAIRLVKRIPMQAGMGGGSSDAAAALVGLNRVWGLGLSNPELHPLAARLGSDVNFFLDSAPAALCRGRGEEIAGHPLPRPLDLLLIKPPGGLSTADVFRAWNASGNASPSGIVSPRSGRRMIDALAGGRLPDVRARLWNALEPPARQLNGEVARTLVFLHGMCRSGVLMTGSGTACFAVCRNRSQALAWGGRARQARLGQVFVLRTAT